MFYKYIYPNLSTFKGKIWGAGIREVPKNMTYRGELASAMKEEIANMTK